MFLPCFFKKLFVPPIEIFFDQNQVIELVWPYIIYCAVMSGKMIEFLEQNAPYNVFVLQVPV